MLFLRRIESAIIRALVKRLLMLKMITKISVYGKVIEPISVMILIAYPIKSYQGGF